MSPVVFRILRRSGLPAILRAGRWRRNCEIRESVIRFSGFTDIPAQGRPALKKTERRLVIFAIAAG
jgi:hypothetical protein